MVFGIFALVIGGLASCTAIFTPLALLLAGSMPRQPGVPPPDVRAVLSAVVVYGVVAAAFIAGGIASIRARRWARPFMLSVAWTWLLLGVFAMVFWIAMLPSMMEIMASAAGPRGAAPPPGMAGVQQAMVWVMTAVMIVLYLVLPTVFILFYRSPHVRTTLEHYDPNPGWADRAPVSVFGLSVGLGVSALFMLPLLGYGVFPLFGTLLTGPAAAVATLACAALLAVAAWLVFRLSIAGWWLTMAISILLPVAMIVTMQTVGVVPLYERMGMPPDQIEAIRNNQLMRGPLIPVATGLLGIAGVIYLLAVRKSFVASSGSGEERGAVAGAS
jgi:uncharacterized membrane protein